MRGGRRRLAACAAVAMVAGLGMADAPVSPVGAQDAIRPRRVTITALPAMAEGDYALPAEINDRGVVTVTSAPGYLASLEPGAQAYLWRNGRVTTLVPPGAEGSSAVNITEDGLVSGSALRDGVAYPFLWRFGRFTDVGVPVTPTARLSLSERGHLAVSNPGNAGVWWRGRYTPIQAPAGVGPSPVMVNNQGTVAGYFFEFVTGAPLRVGGFTWSDGVFTDIAPGNAAQHVLLDVNDRGQAVGVCGHRACLIEDGVTTDLGTLGGSSSYFGAVGEISRNVLNERGQVAGSAAVADTYENHAFLWEDGEMPRPGHARWSSKRGAGAQRGGSRRRQEPDGLR